MSKSLTVEVMALLLTAGLAIGTGQPAHAAGNTITMASCLQSAVRAAVRAAIGSANVGDSVQVPAGSCSWSGLSLSKAFHLKGASLGAIDTAGSTQLRVYFEVDDNVQPDVWKF